MGVLPVLLILVRHSHAEFQILISPLSEQEIKDSFVFSSFHTQSSWAWIFFIYLLDAISKIWMQKSAPPLASNPFSKFKSVKTVDPSFPIHSLSQKNSILLSLVFFFFQIRIVLSLEQEAKVFSSILTKSTIEFWWPVSSWMHSPYLFQTRMTLSLPPLSKTVSFHLSRVHTYPRWPQKGASGLLMGETLSKTISLLMTYFYPLVTVSPSCQMLWSKRMRSPSWGT